MAGAGVKAAPPTVTLRVARAALHGASPRPALAAAPDLGLDLCSAVSQVDPGLRFQPQPMALRERELVQALAQHRLDLHWDLVGTPRRREQLAFLDGPTLWRHRLQLVSHSQDPENLPDLEALRQASQHHGLVAAADSVAAEFLSAVPGVRWRPVTSDESPDGLLRSGARWALLASHARPRSRPPSPQRAQPATWRWQPAVLRDEPVHGAVSLALPAPVRVRLTQALARAVQTGALEALRAQHARV